MEMVIIIIIIVVGILIFFLKSGNNFVDNELLEWQRSLFEVQKMEQEMQTTKNFLISRIELDKEDLEKSKKVEEMKYELRETENLIQKNQDLQIEFSRISRRLNPTSEDYSLGITKILPAEYQKEKERLNLKVLSFMSDCREYFQRNGVNV